MLYCIKCGKMVDTKSAAPKDLFHLNTIQVSSSFDPGSRFDLDVCEFDDGWATTPPPEFDMNVFVEQLEQIKAPIDDDFLPYDYDFATDQIVWII